MRMHSSLTIFSLFVFDICVHEVTSNLLLKCHDFQDLTVTKEVSNIIETQERNTTNPPSNVQDKPEEIEISLPEQSVSTGQNYTFRLTSNVSMNTERCRKIPQQTPTYVNLSIIYDKPYKHTHFTDKLKHIRLRGKIGNHLTPQGYLEYEHFYYPPGEFCVSSLTETDLTIRIPCPANCSSPTTLCLPKCCGIGEVIEYWSFQCMPVVETKSASNSLDDSNHWTPYLYEGPHKRLEKSAKKILYYRPYLNCTTLNLKNETRSAFRSMPFTDVPRPKRNGTIPPDSKHMIRLLDTGHLLMLTHTREWEQIDQNFGVWCIDGFYNFERKKLNGKEVDFKESYRKSEANQVVLSCAADSKPEHGQVGQPGWDKVYAGVLFTSSVFILLTAIVHILLYDRQNMHGLTILSQSVSLFFFYVFHGTAYVVPRDKTQSKEPHCYFVAVASHYFFISTFAWLTVVNFDLWLTFRTMRPISRGISKRMRRFRLYSLLGWGLPLVLVAFFVFLNEHYSNYETEFRTPDYALLNCYVAGHARRRYICSILTILIPPNLLLIVSTFKIFYDFKRGRHGMGNVNLSKRASGDKYSFKLFLKLFVVMGSIWSFDAVLCWFYNNGKEAPWQVNVIYFFMFLQSVAIFLIFCCNRRCIKGLEEKRPCLRVLLTPLKRLLKIEDATAGVAGTETTPTTPAGYRKMSTLSTTSGGNSSTLRKLTLTRQGSLVSNSGETTPSPAGPSQPSSNLPSFEEKHVSLI